MAAITAKKYFENGTCTAQYFTDYNTMCQWLAQHPEAGIEAWEDHQPIDQRQLQADVAAYAAPWTRRSCTRALRA